MSEGQAVTFIMSEGRVSVTTELGKDVSVALMAGLLICPIRVGLASGLELE